MQRINQEEGSYWVILIGIEDDTEEKRESFCKKISENYSISFPLLKKIIDHCPTILKKNLFRNKAETLAKTLVFRGYCLCGRKEGFPAHLSRISGNGSPSSRIGIIGPSEDTKWSMEYHRKGKKYL